jgi:putative salt-induced outer membrane protein
MTLKALFGALAAFVAFAAAPAFAEDGLTGEGSLSAGVTTGNTDTKDLGAALKLANQFGDWRAKGQLAADYGETDDTETRNRFLAAAQLDRDLSERFYVFGRASYEQDEFSSFDNRIFAGVGAGYRVLTGERAKWAVEAGPGYRWDELTTGAKEESVSARAASMFAYKFNDAVAFTNDTEVLYADVSTQVINTAALTAKLTDAFSARFSYDIRHETEALPGRKETDTATRLSLVYGF